MIVLVLVVALAMVPFIIWATRSKGRRGVRWNGIDWNRGMSPAAKLVLEGVRLHDENRDEAAEGAFDRALALEPSQVDALLGRALSRHRVKRLDDALADYDRAIAIAGPTSEALNNRGCLQRDRGDLDRAITDIEEALRLATPGTTEHATALVSLAEVLAQRGEWDRALASLQRAIAEDGTWREYARTSSVFAPLREARPTSEPFAPPVDATAPE